MLPLDIAKNILDLVRIHAKEALDEKSRVLEGKNQLEKAIVNEVASGGRAATINNSLRDGNVDRNAYNGQGTGSDIYINRTSGFATFAHEIGHAQNADRGGMEYNSVRLNDAGFRGDWTRIKDENVADNFASKVIGTTYSGYGFTSLDQEQYDTAIKTLPPY